MKHIGLTQRVDPVPGRGERRDALDQAWTALLVKAGLLPLPIPNTVEDVEGFTRSAKLEGIILTGGNDVKAPPDAPNAAPERDHIESMLLEVCARRKIPVLGVCRGMQMMHVASGGSLVQVDGHVAVPHALEVIVSDKVATMPMVNSFHAFGVAADAVTSDYRAVAFAPDGTVEAMVHSELPFAGVMWHPERPPLNPDDAGFLQRIFGTRSA